jgi:hypothetical protein
MRAVRLLLSQISGQTDQGGELVLQPELVFRASAPALNTPEE